MSTRSRQLFLMAMMLSSALGTALLIMRWFWVGHIAYHFLVWNLLLAWIPFGIAVLAQGWLKRGESTVVAGWLALGAWLVFFPNAPYILTDLIHFKRALGFMWWYDLILVLAFAATGLMLGLASLKMVHKAVATYAGEVRGWQFALISCMLCGFGIYLGRFERFNTWDVLVNPMTLALDIGSRFLNPLDHLRTWGVTLSFGCLMVAMYVALHAMSQQEPALIPVKQEAEL